MLRTPCRTKHPRTLSSDRSERPPAPGSSPHVDEVGRGAWAGPVTVCAAVTGLRRAPAGLTDSKLINPKRRTELAGELAGWVTSYALGHSSPEEIDELGMTAALRLAAVRALEALPVRPDAVILDGKHDYLGGPWQVRTVIKGDQSCVSVAAASVLAKVRRDAMMAELGAGSEEYALFAFGANAGHPRRCTRRRWRNGGRRPSTGSRGPTSTACRAGGTSRRSGSPRRRPRWKAGANSASISETSGEPSGPCVFRPRTWVQMCQPADAFRVGI